MFCCRGGFLYDGSLVEKDIEAIFQTICLVNCLVSGLKDGGC